MKITVMGAGAWGTALAIHFARHGHDVTMWARNAQHVQDLAQARENARYLPGFAFPDALQMQADLGAALQGSELVLMVTSVAGLRDSAQRLIEHNAGHLPVLTACKGFEQDSGLLTFQVVKDVLPDNPCIGVLSGPSFAQELARQLPCAVVLASENKAWIEEMVHELNTQVMRLYGSEDVIGVAVGGAVKNIMAIATGLSDGLEYGLNARAALVTRGLAEITRLGVKLGAEPLTYSGLSGVGDLIVTGTSVHSRNWRAGDALGRGEKLEDIERNMGMVIEGISTTKVAYEIAQELGVYMPITTAIYKVIYEGADVKESIINMMSNEFRSENEWN